MQLKKSIFRLVFDTFYDAVVGSSARVPGQYINFGKRFIAFMVFIGLANCMSSLNHRLDQQTALGQCHEVVNCSHELFLL